MTNAPIIIGHRGACGYAPEHTLASFERAVELGADAIETDVVLTRDGQLICRHDCELSVTTDVASHPEFAARKTVKTIDGIDVKGWFVDDFMLEEIRTLLARERFAFRDQSLAGKLPILALDELLEWAVGRKTQAGNPLRIIVEIKHAAYFEWAGLSMENAVAHAMTKHGLAAHDSTAAVECFEIGVLRRLRQRINTPIVQLLDAPSVRPADVAAAGGATTYRDMLTPVGLAEIAKYATAVGAWKQLIVPAQLDGGPDAVGLRLGAPTSLIVDAHSAGLAVHAWTFRNEPRFLAADYGGHPHREYQQFRELGINGIITDFPDTARAALNVQNQGF